MNCYYKETGATVLVQDENKNVRQIENKENIDGILVLENDKVRLDKLITAFEEKDKENGGIIKSYIKHHHSFFSAVGAVAIASVTGSVILPIFNPNFYLETGPFSLFGIVSTIALLHTKSVGYYNWKNDREKGDFKVKLKNANLLKFAINRELKIERNTKLPTNRISNNFIDIRKAGNVNFKILDYYEENHDKLIQDYKEREEVPFFEDQLYGRLISDMIQKELHDEKKKEDSSIVELAKDKVKSLLK